MRKMSIRLMACAIVLGMALPVQASFMSKLGALIPSYPETRVDSVLITGNFVKSRLLAELIQQKKECPILLVAPGASGMELYFMPYGTDVVQLSQKECVEFIDLQRPKRLVFIGDSQYVPEEIVGMMRGRYPIVQVSGNNWAQNAEALASIFRYKKLPRHFADLLKRAGAAMDTAAAAQPIAPVMALPEPVE
jgi:hypothetical protein